VPKISIVVAEIRPSDQDASAMVEGIAKKIAQFRFDYNLVDDRILHPEKVLEILPRIPEAVPCAVVLVGPPQELAKWAPQFRAICPRVRVVEIAAGEVVQISTRDARLNQVMAALDELARDREGFGVGRSYRIEIPEPANESWPDQPAGEPQDHEGSEDVLILDPPGRVLEAAIKWVHALLRAAAGRLIDVRDDTVQITRIEIRDWLDSERDACTPFAITDSDAAAKVAAAESELTEALECSDNSSEPLARVQYALGLDPTEFRVLVLALAPELDLRHQHWISLLMDDAGRRVGTLGLFEELLGLPSRIAGGLLRSGRLARWRMVEGARDVLPAADAPLRLDPPFRAWLLGDPDGLQDDPALQRLLRTAPWPGEQLVCDRTIARALIDDARQGDTWVIVTAGGGGAALRALLEAGAKDCGVVPIRVDLSGLPLADPAECSDIGARVARAAVLLGAPLVLDASNVENGPAADGALQALFAAIARTAEARGVIIAVDAARIIRLIEPQDYRIEPEPANAKRRIEALKRAAELAEAALTDEAAESVANLYPLQIDGLELAMHLARRRPLPTGAGGARARFITACKEISAEGASGLAQRIEPTFELSDVILPLDRKNQLEEIVDNIRFAPRVLEGWKFRDQLPYGLGVTVMFHGPSGTGKTMASMAIAKTLGIQLLRIDLSRLVSKYIGDTEKNIDRIFVEAQLSGAALLIDEADGLLARRGEVKDAHDRYANLEVAYLLQRMEAFEGLAILTTNLKQNVDTAFLRRLRFIVEFPRPDAAAREEIWRRCLPKDSHELSDAMFRQLGRRVELTGGSIRQITLRAAFLAAAAGTRINSAQVAYATRAEFTKLGLPAVELDTVDGRAAA
jgi:AAA+ superfamily predicted ATPase